MSSTNKSENLKLNQWIGTDVPSRQDFCDDNRIIDQAVGGHITDYAKHVTTDEKYAWNNPYYMTTFYGDGTANRSIVLNCSFSPSWGIIFAASKTPSVVNIENDANFNYFGIFSNRGSNSGLSISGKQFNIVQAASPVFSTEYRNYNEAGVSYVAIFFR